MLQIMLVMLFLLCVADDASDAGYAGDAMLCREQADLYLHTCARHTKLLLCLLAFCICIA